MPRFSQLERNAQIYLAVVIGLGVALVPLGYLLFPLDPHTVPELLYLAFGAQVAALLPVRWTSGNQIVVAPLLVATALVSPGTGIALTAWLFLNDGRWPSAKMPLWAWLWNRCQVALSYGVPALVVAHLTFTGFWSTLTLPARAAVLSLLMIVINYGLMARMVAFLQGSNVWQVIQDNVGFAAIRSLLVLGVSGGILYELLLNPVGYLLAPALFGFVLSVRSNMAAAQQQAEARVQTLELAAQALDARDRYTEDHSLRVAELAAKIADQLQLGGKEIELLRTAGSLHDMGKIGVRDSVLNKPGRLTPEEWQEMKRHAEIGAEMIAKHSMLAPAAPMVRHHHERWDGGGYPDSLVGEDIPLGARILAVADSFDTITADRVYRLHHLTTEEAIDDITNRAGAWYDPMVVDAFRSVYGQPRVFEHQVEHEARVAPYSVRQLLRNPRFARLLVSTGISALGDPLTLVASLVAVYSATRQPLAVSAAFGVQAAATILVGLFGGAIPDRLKRSRLIPILEFCRAILLVCTPFLLSRTLVALFLVLFLLAAAEAVVQPARQAAVPEVVERRALGTANAALAAVSRFVGAIGFGLAGLIIWLTNSSEALFVIDGLTFAVAGILVLRIGDLGGGVAVRAFEGVARAWAVKPARGHLVVAALSAFFITMSYPGLITLAYERSAPGHGAQGYSILQIALGLGVALGAVVVSRLEVVGAMRTVAQGLLVTGLMSVAIAFPSSLWVTALLLVLASLGNSFYSVGNQTALLETGDSQNRGSIMSFRFAAGQTALVLGSAVGGYLAWKVGAGTAYALLGIGLLGVAICAAWMGRIQALAEAGVDTSPPRPPMRVAGGPIRALLIAFLGTGAALLLLKALAGVYF